MIPELSHKTVFLPSMEQMRNEGMREVHAEEAAQVRGECHNPAQSLPPLIHVISSHFPPRGTENACLFLLFYFTFFSHVWTRQSVHLLFT